MKIAFNMLSASHGGGFNTYNKNILNQLFIDDDLDNDFFIFTNDNSLQSDKKNIHLIHVPNLFSKTLLRIFWMQFILPLNLLFKKVDILFSPMNIVPIALYLSKIKNILVIHSNLPWLFPNDVPGSRLKFYLQLSFTNLSIKIADKIIVDSETAKKELASIHNNFSNKIVKIYLGVKKSRENLTSSKKIFINKLNIHNEEYFLTISSAARYHCLIELIEAYELLCREDEDCPKLLLISKNLDQEYFLEIKNAILNANFSEKIILVENVNIDIIPDLYINSSLYIFSSYCEVFGLTNLEAMSYETPVITSNKSSIPEICGNAARYFDPLDPIDIKKVIVSVYYNDSEKKSMIINGIKRVNNFPWSRTYYKTKDVIINS